MTDITPERLAQIKARADKATAGPWDEIRGNTVRAVKGDFAVPIFESLAPIDWHKNKRLTDGVMCKAYSDEVNNAAFIASARQDIPDLIAALEAAQAENANLRAGLDASKSAFKNFHRMLCDRFEYTHDAVDWQRDQVSLMEWIADRMPKSGAKP
jgi:hypothetical protein